MESNKVLAQAIGFLALAEGLFIYVQGVRVTSGRNRMARTTIS